MTVFPGAVVQTTINPEELSKMPFGALVHTIFDNGGLIVRPQYGGPYLAAPVGKSPEAKVVRTCLDLLKGDPRGKRYIKRTLLQFVRGEIGPNGQPLPNKE